jgi:beta-ribofuranosylaminobenzene 5'-phosphate synthase
MSRIQIRTPSRLHFGLLAWGPHSPRQFGGVGLMIESPRIELSAEPAPDWRADGPLARRALQVADRVAGHLAARGTRLAPAHLRIHRAPVEHVGLGVGTQLSLAVARALFALSDLPDPSIDTLSALTGRGQRSGIGLHGFVRGGLIVDGGRRGPDGIPPLLSHVTFPPEWAILVIQARRFTGLHGADELRAFAELPPIADRVTDHLCRLVLLGLLPSILEHDLESFGAALTDLQQHVGHCFAPAQGGLYARPELEAIVNDLRAQGLHGVGQSSWGPTLYAVSDQPPDQRQSILGRTRSRFELPEDAVFWTHASPHGSRLERLDGSREP